MRKILFANFVVLIALTGFNTAAAEDGDKYGFVLGSLIEPDIGLNLDNGIGARLGLGKEVGERVNIELGVGYMRADGQNSPSLGSVSYGLDVQLVFNRGGSFEPYLLAGLEEVRFDLDNTPTETDFGSVYGAGFRGDLFGDRGVEMRAEYRYRTVDAFDLDLDDNFYSFGIQIPFGKKSPVLPAVAPVLDDDNDGVVNEQDRCPNTPAGARVDASGCALDSDGDGVADHADQCPGTVRGAAVDENGCELDSDADGVVDRLDECPDSAPGVQVDIKGCEIEDEIRLPGVNFESNSDRLLPGAESALNNAAATLDKNPEIKVEVAGHTDSDGAAEYNESLSARRAATVRDYLISKGIAEDRLTTRGYGESQPITGNDTVDGKAANRRVVLRITER
jgi:OOP family OmpA-OmpF porin